MAALTLGLVLTASPAQANDSAAREAGLGAASALSTLIYGPAKGLYALGGLLISGGAWLFSAGDSAVVGPILNASVRGDYVVTPEHLTGRRPLQFIGRPPADRHLGVAAQPRF